MKLNHLQEMDETGDHNVKQNETAKERQESHALIHL
jgi:hypothetical protein